MNARIPVYLILSITIPVLVLSATPWAEAGDAASFQLTAMSLERLRKEGLPGDAIEKLLPLIDQEFDNPKDFIEAVRKQIGTDQTSRHQELLTAHATDEISEIKKVLERLQQRIKEIETEKTVQEDATRAIIKDALSTVGSNINEAVALSGTLEVNGGWKKDFNDETEGLLQLDTVELELDVRVNDWTTGSIMLEWDDGSGQTVRTTSGDETLVDRIKIDTALLAIGDARRFPPVLTIGRMTLPFGISSGNSLGSVLTVEDPLTVDVFKTKQTAIALSFGFPTPGYKAPIPPVTVPRVRPLVIKPLLGALFRGLGYKPFFRPPLRPAATTPALDPPIFNLMLYAYDGATYNQTDTGGFQPNKHYGGSIGLRTSGSCGRPFDQLEGRPWCPWVLDIDIDYISSVFDSRFLHDEYKSFFDQIGLIPGLALSMKVYLGPVSVLAEWNGALEPITFNDGEDEPINIQPASWQITLGYQFDWNPWVETIGAQGTYIALGYSESRDMGGVSQIVDGVPERVGYKPQRRYCVSVGEWVLDNLRLALEYAYEEDYTEDDGGSGNSANTIISSISIEW